MDFTDDELYDIELALNLFYKKCELNISKLMILSVDFISSVPGDLQQKLNSARKTYKETRELLNKIRGEMIDRGMNLEF